MENLESRAVWKWLGKSLGRWEKITEREIRYVILHKAWWLSLIRNDDFPSLRMQQNVKWVTGVMMCPRILALSVVYISHFVAEKLSRTETTQSDNVDKIYHYWEKNLAYFYVGRLNMANECVFLEHGNWDVGHNIAEIGNEKRRDELLHIKTMI